jgi:hypothetical protein
MRWSCLAVFLTVSATCFSEAPPKTPPSHRPEDGRPSKQSSDSTESSVRPRAAHSVVAAEDSLTDILGVRDPAQQFDIMTSPLRYFGSLKSEHFQRIAALDPRYDRKFLESHGSRKDFSLLNSKLLKDTVKDVSLVQWAHGKSSVLIRFKNGSATWVDELKLTDEQVEGLTKGGELVDTANKAELGVSVYLSEPGKTMKRFIRLSDNSRLFDYLYQFQIESSGFSAPDMRTEKTVSGPPFYFFETAKGLPRTYFYRVSFPYSDIERLKRRAPRP